MDTPNFSNSFLPVPVPNTQIIITDQEEVVHKSFIKGNTVAASYDEIKRHHIIPVYKDNEPVISHSDFIDSVYDVASHVYGQDSVTEPQIRVSHPIMGRIPEAKSKPASELYEHEKTLYYERMMFVMDVPCNFDDVDGNHLSLTVGGVKAYNLDNLYSKKGSDEHFKVFIGFKNAVCTNLCVSTDGLAADIRVTNPRQLREEIYHLLSQYNAVEHLRSMQQLTQYHLTERQFAELVGRCRMYQFLSPKQRQGIPPLLYGDQQINSICRDYYRDKSFCRSEDGDINLFKLYNLFTGACKSTYIDQFLPRSVNAFDICKEIQGALDGRSSWFLQ
jgi:hypothetical protein